MATTVATCPKCSKRYKVHKEQLGKTARCEQCGTAFPLSARSAPTDGGATRRSPGRDEKAEEVPAEWQVGDVILDRYEVKAIHTGGGMGLVYRVHHRYWEEDLAVKSPRGKFLKTAQHRESFVRECLTWIGLGLHPQVVCCYYVRVLGGIPRVFAEYVEGGSLRDWIDSRRLYEGGADQALERILDIAIQFAWGLHYAHEKGLIHRDVKPGNVMMTPDGIAKVTDFGLTKARAAAGVEFVPDSGRSILLSIGRMTPAYCSPEQANRDKLSRRTDIWSWAVSVLEMFTGEVTWLAGQAAAQALDSYLDIGAEDDPIPKMPEELAGSLRECLQRNPKDRPGDFGVVADRLRSVYAQVTGRPYAREEPKPATALADALSNQGVSLFDLGMKEEAERKFADALAADPHHPEATYNQGLLLWRSGRMTDDQLVKRLEEVCKSHGETTRDEVLLARVHMERGDAESTVKLLEGLAGAGKRVVEVQAALTWACARRSQLGSPRVMLGARAALARVRAGLRKWRWRRQLRKGHVGWVNAVAITPDGQRVVLGAWDRTPSLWDVATGKCLRTFEGHTGWVQAVAIAPDGQYAVSGSVDKTLRLWHLPTGGCLRTFEGHTGWVQAVAITPDGHHALSGSDDRSLRLWDLATGACLRSFEGHTSSVNSVAIARDGQYAVSGSEDKTLRLWHLPTGGCLRTFEGHTGGVQAVAITPDGHHALSGSDDRSLRLWDLATGQHLRTFEGHSGSVTVVAITPDGQRALSGSDDKTLRLWDLATGQCLRTFEPRSAWLRGVAITPDGQRGVWGSDDRTFSLCDLATGSAAKLAPTRPSRTEHLLGRESKVAQALDQARAALQHGDMAAALSAVKLSRELPGFERESELLHTWRELAAQCRTGGLRDAWCSRTFKGHTGSVEAVAVTPDNQRALSGSMDNTLRLWHLPTGACLRSFEGHTSSVTSVAIAPDGQYAVSGSVDKTLRLWHLPTGGCLRTFEGHTGWVQAVAITPDGHHALSGSDDRSLRLWDLATGQHLRTFEGHSGSVTVVAITLDGQRALSGSHDKTLRLWDLATGQCLRIVERPYGEVLAVAITPNGRWALCRSHSSYTVRIWNLATSPYLRGFKGHTGWVEAVAITPDGQCAVSGSRDRTLRLWDLATRQCLRTFEGHMGSVTSVAMAPDGQCAVSGSRDRTLRLWQLDWDLEFPGWSNWDEGARPHLETFLTLQCPYGDDGISRSGAPKWDDESLKKLLKQLQYAGYGWLRPEGVRKELEKMTREWQGPPPLPGME